MRALRLGLSGLMLASCSGPGSAADARLDGAPSSSYLILSSVPEGDPFDAAVTRLKQHRGATVLRFDPASLDAIRGTLASQAPRYVAVVLRPEELDTNFVRRFLMFSTELDDDPFSDFSYGFITGATGADALAFVERIIRAEQAGVASRPLTVAGWAASTLNVVYTSESGFLGLLSPARVAKIYLQTGDPQVISFFEKNAGGLAGASLLDVGENGDPHMLWLFEGGNDVKDTWSFDPAKVESPPVQRLGLTSAHVRKLDLYPAVAFNGACHSGVPRRALVESDILATFGDTGGTVRFFSMSEGFSFALAMLRTGITGYFAPVGANNANDKTEEVHAAFLHGEPLGDIHKRSLDAVVMAFLGNRPALRRFAEGDSAYLEETLPSGSYDPKKLGPSGSVMLSGKANRVYFGDPLYSPFARLRSDALRLVTTTLKTEASGHRLDLAFRKPATYFPLWDKFHSGGARIYASVELPESYQGGVTLKVLASSGSYHRLVHAIERHLGKTILHLETAIDDPEHGLAALSFDLSLSLVRTGR